MALASGEPAVAARAELLRALALLVEPPGPEHARVAAPMGLASPDEATFTEVFVLQLPPYASIYLGSEGMLGGEARARVGGFWGAVGRDAPAEPDHLAALLGLYARLIDDERERTGAERELVGHGREALLREHLSTWIFGYLDRVRALGAAPWDAWAELLDAALTAELPAVDDGPVPLHLRDAEPLPDPRTEGGDAFLSGLLAPVRSGVILTRRALADASRALGLGLRIGERRYVLEHLLGQEPVAVLRALADEARSQSGEHARRRNSTGPIADFWSGRALATATLLGELGREGADALARAAEAPR